MSQSDASDLLTFSVAPQEAGLRLDRFLALRAQVSRRQARLWIGSGWVQVGGRPLRVLTRPLRAGTQVRVHLQPAPQPVQAAAHLAPEVLFLDPHVLAVAKPAGLLSEPDRFGSPSVLGWGQRMLAERGQKDALWLVHRLDAGTSGLLILARRPRAAARLGEAFAQRQAHKRYLALCIGAVARQRLTGAIGRRQGTQHGVCPEGRPARTDVAPLASIPSASLVCAAPHTGRTHQIRVHLSHAGHPLMGDPLYGGPRYGPAPAHRPIGRAMLHALRLSLPHPDTQAPLNLSASVPRDMQQAAADWGLHWPALHPLPV